MIRLHFVRKETELKSVSKLLTKKLILTNETTNDKKTEGI